MDVHAKQAEDEAEWPTSPEDGYVGTDDADLEDLHRAAAVWRELGYVSRHPSVFGP